MPNKWYRINTYYANICEVIDKKEFTEDLKNELEQITKNVDKLKIFIDKSNNTLEEILIYAQNVNIYYLNFNLSYIEQALRLDINIDNIENNQFLQNTTQNFLNKIFNINNYIRNPAKSFIKLNSEILKEKPLYIKKITEYLLILEEMNILRILLIKTKGVLLNINANLLM